MTQITGHFSVRHPDLEEPSRSPEKWLPPADLSGEEKDGGSPAVSTDDLKRAFKREALPTTEATSRHHRPVAPSMLTIEHHPAPCPVRRLFP
ncbi:hypothetical protein J7E97_27840 [Streptomyces sp. ISL-66]|uniref:hypothetical protein n=1 Tax=Streptomyces sp. ISL-66 TaxID=2819186 RepID=UPI001BEA049D|nr:hypothetical protein [Streptomyces sp. ISL-66]MBT2471572.1 hypothetical protein [Streptomyces sp. ISL-66]